MMFSMYNTKLAASSPELHEVANIEVKLVCPEGYATYKQPKHCWWTMQRFFQVDITRTD
jgi:hypothetical protein